MIPPTVTKKVKIETINTVISNNEGLSVHLTTKAIKSLVERELLENCYQMAWYVLNWEYGRMYSDNKLADIRYVYNLIITKDK